MGQVQGKRKSKNKQRIGNRSTKLELTEEQLLQGAWPTDHIIRQLRPPATSQESGSVFSASFWSERATVSLNKAMPLEVWSAVVRNYLSGRDVLSLRTTCKRLRECFPFDVDVMVGDQRRFSALNLRRRLYWLVQCAPELAQGITCIRMGVYTLNTERDAQVTLEFLQLVAPTLQEMSFVQDNTHFIYNGERGVTHQVAKLFKDLKFPTLRALGRIGLFFANYMPQKHCKGFIDLFPGIDYSQLQAIHLDIDKAIVADSAKRLHRMKRLKNLSLSGYLCRKVVLQAVQQLPLLQELRIDFLGASNDVDVSLQWIVQEFLLGKASTFRETLQQLSLKSAVVEQSAVLAVDRENVVLSYEPRFPADLCYPELTHLELCLGFITAKSSEHNRDFSPGLVRALAPCCPKLIAAEPLPSIEPPSTIPKRATLKIGEEESLREMEQLLRDHPRATWITVVGVSDARLALLAKILTWKLEGLILECKGATEITDGAMWELAASPALSRLRFLTMHEAHASKCTLRLFLFLHAYLYQTLEGFDISPGLHARNNYPVTSQQLFDDIYPLEAAKVDLNPLVTFVIEHGRDFLRYWQETTGMMWVDEYFSD